MRSTHQLCTAKCKNARVYYIFFLSIIYSGYYKNVYGIMDPKQGLMQSPRPPMILILLHFAQKSQNSGKFSRKSRLVTISQLSIYENVGANF